MRYLLVALAIALASSARADDEMLAAAKRYFESGNRLFEQGRFADAAHEFELAYREQPRPGLLYNAASAHDKAGARREAICAYQRYLAAPGRDAQDDPSVRARVAVLERELAMWSAPPSHTAYPYVESSTGRAFPTYLTVANRELALVGAGARSVLGFKVYAMGLYVDDAAARKAFPKLAAKAGGADAVTLAKGDLAPQFVVQGEFAKRAVMKFEREVAAQKQRDAYREALGDDIAGGRAPADVRRDAEAFLALFDRDVRPGDELVIQTDADGTVWVSLAGRPMRRGPTNVRLEYAIWDIWLGAKPISGDLKRRLTERIDVLGR